MRQEGYYWVLYEDWWYIAEYTNFGGKYTAYFRMIGETTEYTDEDFQEINETKIGETCHRKDR